MTLSIQLIQDLAVILIAASVAGWACRKLKISSVVGYLVAGIIIGTPQITFVYVTNPDRIHTLSQLGLVCLMFFIGLQFRIRKLKELGAGVIIATALTAIITLTLTRIVTTTLGYSEAESLFISGMLVVSSSAIISRVLEEYKLNHSRFGQLALGMTLLEDMVAIVMLAWLGSYSAAESAAASGSALGPLLKTLGLLAGFVTLVMVPGVFLIPKWLKRLGSRGETEPESLLIGGLLFSMAVLTVLSGFSLALGAFLCGVIVAESANAQSITKNFTALKDIFVTVFFTAIGMSIDIMRFPEAISLILLGVGLAFTVRVVASTISFLLVGESEENALRAGLCVTPIGEFSFVIASLGISTGLLSPDFQIAAVGISFATSLFSPLLIKQSNRVAKVFSPSRIKVVGKPLHIYRQMLNRIDRRRRSNPMARILAPRIWQIAREFLFATAVLVFARPGYQATTDWISQSYPAYERFASLYWVAVVLLCLLPVVALLRNGNSLAVIVAEYFFGAQKQTKSYRIAFVGMLRLLGLTLTGLWLFNFLPYSWMDGYPLMGIGLAAIVGAIVGWRFLIRLYSHMEIAMAESITGSPEDGKFGKQLKESSAKWNLSLVEYRLPDDTIYSGKSIAETQLRSHTEASIIGVERQGFQLASLSPSTQLFPRDLLYLVGKKESLEKARDHFSVTDSQIQEQANLAVSVLDQVIVQNDASCIGASLKELQWPSQYGVQVAAILSNGQQHIFPDFDQRIQSGDVLLLAGPKAAIDALRQKLSKLPVGQKDN